MIIARALIVGFILILAIVLIILLNNHTGNIEGDEEDYNFEEADFDESDSDSDYNKTYTDIPY